MSAVDTIVILEGLQFTKPDTADVWTIDGEGSGYEAVKTYNIGLPEDVTAVRVLFNNWYDIAPSRVHVRVKATKVTEVSATGVPTKTENTQVQEWIALGITPAGTPSSLLATSVLDLSACLMARLHIDCAITSTTAHSGTEIIVQTRSENTTPGEWTDFMTFIGPTGTAVKSDFAAEEAAGQTTLSVANPTAGKLNKVAKKIFLEDTVTVAQCEIAYLVDFGADS